MSRAWVVLAVALLAGCLGPASQQPDVTVPATPSSGPAGHAGTLYGVTWNPPSGADMELAKRAGTLVAWRGGLDAIDAQARQMARTAGTHGLETLVLVDLFDGGPLPWDGGDEAGRHAGEAATAALQNLVRDAPSIRWVGLGIGVDAWEQDAGPLQVDRFRGWYNATFEALHETAPGLNVFPVYGLEHLMGGHGDRDARRWDALDLLPRDLLAVTSRPDETYGDPERLPAEPFAPLVERREPWAVVSIGWSAARDPSETPEAGEEEQADAVRAILARTAGARIVVWSDLWDRAPEPNATEARGLLRWDGTPRPAWDVWMVRDPDLARGRL